LRRCVGEELALGRIGHVAIIGEAGIGADPTDQVFQRFEFFQRLAEPFVARLGAGGIERLPFHFSWKAAAFTRAFSISPKKRGPSARGVEVAKIPAGKIAQCRRSTAFIAGCVTDPVGRLQYRGGRDEGHAAVLSNQQACTHRAKAKEVEPSRNRFPDR
jgi:hypothetical protein